MEAPQAPETQLYSTRTPVPIVVFSIIGLAFYSLSDARNVDRNAGLIERPKLLGFVGIQTGFGSADPDPDGLLRLEQATGLAFRFVIGKEDGRASERDR